jgi:hypothetical protein
MTVSMSLKLQQFFGNALRFLLQSLSSPLAAAVSSSFSIESVRCEADDDALIEWTDAEDRGGGGGRRCEAAGKEEDVEAEAEDDAGAESGSADESIAITDGKRATRACRVPL